MISRYLAPYKQDKPVLTGSCAPSAFDEHCIDALFLFRCHDKFHLLYISFDSQGYQAALVMSADLFHWQFKGIILKYGGPGRWDSVGAAGASMLRESYELVTLSALRKYTVGTG